MESTIMRIVLLAALVLLLVTAGIEDARTRRIADHKTIAIALLAPLWWWANGLPVWPDMAVQVAAMLVAFLLFAQGFRIGMMGGGDVKMIAAIALWLPLPSLLRMILLMSVIGGAVTIAMLIDRAVRSRMARDAAPIEVPYGVAIAIAAMIVLQEPLFNPFRPI